jgi:hypothetical protein
VVGFAASLMRLRLLRLLLRVVGGLRRGVRQRGESPADWAAAPARLPAPEIPLPLPLPLLLLLLLLLPTLLPNGLRGCSCSSVATTRAAAGAAVAVRARGGSGCWAGA